MRKMFLTAAMIAGFAAAGSLMPSQANAMAISSPQAVQQALGEGSMAEQVRYVCYRVRHCGWRGCHWRRSCHWRPNHHWRRHHYWRRHHWY